MSSFQPTFMSALTHLKTYHAHNPSCFTASDRNDLKALERHVNQILGAGGRNELGDPKHHHSFDRARQLMKHLQFRQRTHAEKMGWEEELIRQYKYNDRHKPAGSPNSTGGEFDFKPGGAHQLRRYPRNANPSPAIQVTVHNRTHITLHHEDGSSESRAGGSRAWRNNNPGNVVHGSFAQRHGAIGNNHGMAVFPDAHTGYEADTALLKGPTYAPLTINKAIATRSPPIENNTPMLQREIPKRSGLSGDRVIKDLKPEEFARLQEAIYPFEGWHEGNVIKTPPKTK